MYVRIVDTRMRHLYYMFLLFVICDGDFSFCQDFNFCFVFLHRKVAQYGQFDKFLQKKKGAAAREIEFLFSSFLFQNKKEETNQLALIFYVYATIV